MNPVRFVFILAFIYIAEVFVLKSVSLPPTESDYEKYMSGQKLKKEEGEKKRKSRISKVKQERELFAKSETRPKIGEKNAPPRNVMIFVDYEESGKNIPITQHLILALGQQAAPIITTPYLLTKAKELANLNLSEEKKQKLQSFLEQEIKIEKISEINDGLKRINEEVRKDAANISDDFIYIFLSSILFNQKEFEKNWKIFKGTSDFLVLLVPRRFVEQIPFSKFNIFESNDLSVLGFDPGLTMVNLEEIPKNIKKPQQQDFSQFFVHEKIESGGWNIFLHGHGGYKKQVAGLDIDSFKKLLIFLKNKVSTKFLYFATCYGGAKTFEIINQAINTANSWTESVNPDFPIVSAATGAFILYYGSRLKDKFSETEILESDCNAIRLLFHYSFDYIRFFKEINLAEQAFSFKDNPNAAVSKISDIIDKSLNVSKNSSALANIRIPGSGFVKSLEKDKNAQVITLTESLKKQININNQNVIIYPQVIKSEIVMSSDLFLFPSFISSSSGDFRYYFENITLNALAMFGKNDQNFLFRSFTKITSNEKPAIFFINKLLFKSSFKETIEDPDLSERNRSRVLALYTKLYSPNEIEGLKIVFGVDFELENILVIQKGAFHFSDHKIEKNPEITFYIKYGTECGWYYFNNETGVFNKLDPDKVDSLLVKIAYLKEDISRKDSPVATQSLNLTDLSNKVISLAESNKIDLALELLENLIFYIEAFESKATIANFYNQILSDILNKTPIQEALKIKLFAKLTHVIHLNPQISSDLAMRILDCFLEQLDSAGFIDEPHKKKFCAEVIPQNAKSRIKALQLKKVIEARGENAESLQKIYVASLKPDLYKEHESDKISKMLQNLKISLVQLKTKLDNLKSNLFILSQKLVKA